MFNIGFLEFILIAFIGLVFIGPKQLPQVARTIGRLVGEFRRATNEFTGNISRMENEAHKVVDSVSMDIKNEAKEISQKLTVDIDTENHNKGNS